MDEQNLNNSNYQDNTQTVTFQETASTPDNSNGGKATGIQTAALVLGILSIVFSCCYGVPGLIMGIIGLVCSIKGRKEGNSGVNTAGLVCSIVGIILSVIMLIYFIIVGAAVFSALSDPSVLEQYR